MAALGLICFWNAPAVPEAGWSQGVHQVPPLEIKALLWNIYGKTNAGCAGARNLLVPRVVRQLNPDVLLLQEIPSQKITDTLCDCCCGRRYNYVLVGNLKQAGNLKHAGILYDESMFTPVAPALDLRDTVEEVFPQGVANFETELKGELEVYRDRAIAVQLRHKATQSDVIFVSFQNNRRWVGPGGVLAKATRFWNVVAALGHQNVPVVAGADLNCENFARAEAAFAPGYVSTPRRERVPQLDHFILSWSANIDVECALSAVDVFPDAVPEPTHPFDQTFVELWNVYLQIPLVTYMNSLDHDPLMCDVKITW